MIGCCLPHEGSNDIAGGLRALAAHEACRARLKANPEGCANLERAAALLAHFRAQGWLRRAGRGARGGHCALLLTPSGRRHLLPRLTFDWGSAGKPLPRAGRRRGLRAGPRLWAVSLRTVP